MQYSARNHAYDLHIREALQRQMTPSAFDEAYAAGEAMSIDELLVDVDRTWLSPFVATSESRSVANPCDPLTRREWDVARLLARRHTDRQIASELSIALGTVGVHVHNILTKLGLRSRWQVAEWAAARER
jgi:non-specific serine/threonine protein kinase